MFRDIILIPQWREAMEMLHARLNARHLCIYLQLGCQVWTQIRYCYKLLDNVLLIILCRCNLLVPYTFHIRDSLSQYSLYCVASLNRDIYAIICHINFQNSNDILAKIPFEIYNNNHLESAICLHPMEQQTRGNISIENLCL